LFQFLAILFYYIYIKERKRSHDDKSYNIPRIACVNEQSANCQDNSFRSGLKLGSELIAKQYQTPYHILSTNVLNEQYESVHSKDTEGTNRVDRFVSFLTGTSDKFRENGQTSNHNANLQSIRSVKPDYPRPPILSVYEMSDRNTTLNVPTCDRHEGNHVF
jgi:hypothetical protein